MVRRVVDVKGVSRYGFGRGTEVGAMVDDVEKSWCG